MIITLLPSGNIRCTRFNGSERYYTESAFYYAVRKKLNGLGLDVIKRRPDKDGHLTSAEYYIRDRKGRFAWFDTQYMIRSNNNRFEDGVTLAVHGDLPEDVIKLLTEQKEVR
jgi:hypothetical protein